MEIAELLNKVSIWVKRYRYVLLVLVIGIALMMVPGKQEKIEDSVALTETVPKTELWLDAESLESTLIQIKGAGKVKVLLSCATGEKRIYQSDDNTVHSGDSSTVESKTVVLVDGSKNETPLITQVKGPEYLGAIVVCQGADDPEVRLAVFDAVSKATGLGTDRISVLKMK